MLLVHSETIYWGPDPISQSDRFRKQIRLSLRASDWSKERQSCFSFAGTGTLAVHAFGWPAAPISIAECSYAGQPLMLRETISLYPYARSLLNVEAESWVKHCEVQGLQIDRVAIEAQIRHDYKTAMRILPKPAGRIHWAAFNSDTEVPNRINPVFMFFNQLRRKFDVSYKIAYNIPLSLTGPVILPTIAAWSLRDRDITSKIARALARSSESEDLLTFALYVVERYPQAHKLQAMLKLLQVPPG
jgi:hypothetical protein